MSDGNSVKMKTEFVPRVNQLDAIQLDQDIIRIVRDHLLNAAQSISPYLASKLHPEIDFLLRAAIWNFSIRSNSATFGQQLLFMAYDKDQLFKSYNIYKHFFFNILIKYIRDNITFRWTDQERLQKWVAYCENVLAICTMVNFFRFLHVGKRPSLVDYTLGLDNISMYGNRRREIGYSHMTRELIWGGFMELLGFTLPLVNYHYVKRKCRNAVDFVMGGKSKLDEDQKPVLNANTKCAYCDQRPTIPYHMGCRHVFCYYCLKGNLLADELFECPSCEKRITFSQSL